MHFAVLGALRVRDASGSEVVIRGRSRRLLFGALLARAGQPVPLDTLMDDLWGASIPPSAERTLRSHVTRLRDDLLYAVDVPGTGEVLGGIEWVGQSESNPDELPAPEDLTVTLATP